MTYTWKTGNVLTQPFWPQVLRPNFETTPWSQAIRNLAGDEWDELFDPCGRVGLHADACGLCPKHAKKHRKTRPNALDPISVR